MKKSILILAALAGGVSFSSAEVPTPRFLVNIFDESVAAARVDVVDSTTRGRSQDDLVLGVDDTMETHLARLPSSARSGPAPYARTRMTTVAGTTQGFEEIKVFHDGRIAYKADNGNVVSSRYHTTRNLVLAAFRVSGNGAPVAVEIDTEVEEVVLTDPPGTAGKSQAGISCRWKLRTVSTEVELAELHGSIEVDTRYDVSPRFENDFAGLAQSYSFFGNGKFDVSCSHTESLTIGYGVRYSWFTELIGVVTAESMDPAENATLEVGPGDQMYYRISSPDAAVRFVIYEKEDPAPRPDLWIGRSLGSLKGDGVYGSTAGQRIPVKQGKRKRASFYLRLENDGPDLAGGSEDNAFSLRGPKKKGALRFSYVDSRGNVTAAVASGRYFSDGLFPEEYESIQVRTKRKDQRGGKLKKRNKVNFVTSNPGGGVDVNQALVKLR